MEAVVEDYYLDKVGGQQTEGVEEDGRNQTLEPLSDEAVRQTHIIKQLFSQRKHLFVEGHRSEGKYGDNSKDGEEHQEVAPHVELRNMDY